jgi:predicted dithiol-disulfide oxidoreductase (DUF899 family)
MSDPQIATREQWLTARLELLTAEKELTRRRDEINAARRRLPMVEVTDENYQFDGPDGRVPFGTLFDGRSQLVIYHFMFDPDADEGCSRCSFTVDNVGHLSHLYARDTSFALVSRAPFAKLDRYRRRMGWTVPWYSSYGSDFNYAFHVSFDEAIAPLEYNYKDQATLEQANPAWRGWIGEEQGASAFLRHGDRIFHTYSSYARGNENLNGTWSWLDLTARGRQEDWELEPRRGSDPFMAWLRRHDEYGSDS